MTKSTVRVVGEPALIVKAVPTLELERNRRNSYRIRRFFPDCLPGCKAGSLVFEDHVIRPGYQTPVCRVLYQKHLEFFRNGARDRERLALAGNRVGKTEGMGAYELTLHATGEYPDWWEGHVFDGPIHAWAAGDTSKTVRDIVQLKLLGPVEAKGTGMIPAHLIYHTTAKQGLSDAVEMIWVTHRSGGRSVINLKSYDQRREAFQGTSQHVIWLDEEPPEDIYTECVLRTMDTPDLPGGGIVMMTFTPLQGLTPLVLSFLPEAGIDATPVAE